MITGRIPKGNQNPSQRNTKSQSGKSDVSSNPSQPSRAPIRLSDAIAERLGGNDSRQNPGRGDNGVPSPRGTRAESENSSDNAGRGNSVGTQEERIAAKEEKNKGNDVSDPRRPNNSSLLDQLSNPGNGRRESDDSETGGMDNREESASTETQQPAPVEDDPNENDQTVNEEETDVDEQQTPLDPGYENQPNDNQQQCPPSVRDIVIGIIDRIDRNSGPVIVESSSDIIVVPSVEPEPAVSAPVQRRIRTDLEVVDIRFVDFGDRDKNTGPSFKVCVRNHNNKFAANDVDVALVAAIDLDDANQGRVAETASIESIGPRQTVEIEIRLPRKSYELATRDGQTAIFSEMAAIVDPDEKFMDVRPDNNLMIRDIDDIEMDE